MKELNVRMPDDTFAQLHTIAKEYQIKDRATGNMRSMTLGEFMTMLCKALSMTERIDGMRKLPKPDPVDDYLKDQVRQYGSHLEGPTITSTVPIVCYTRNCICTGNWPVRSIQLDRLIHSVECDEANQ